MNTKRLAVLAISTLTLSWQAAWAQSSDLRGDVSLWMYPVIPNEKDHRDLWNRIIADFNKQYPNVKVNVDIQPWAGRNEKLIAAVAAGRAPNLVYLIPDQIPQFVKINALQPITLSAKDRADYLSSALNGVTYQGKLYTAPILMSAYVPTYNKAIFTRFNLSYPKSWLELEKAGRTLKQNGLYLFAYPGGLEDTLNGSFYPFLWQAGGRVFAADGKSVTFNNDAGVRALSFLVKLYKAGYIEPTSATRTLTGNASPMVTQKAAMLPNTDVTTARQIIDLWGNKPDQLVVGRPLLGSRQITYGTVGGFAMPVQRGGSETTQAFLNFLIQPQYLRQIDLASGFFAPKRSIGKVHDADPLVNAMEESARFAIPGEIHPQSRQVMDVLSPEIQAAMLGKKTPKQALDDAARAANQLIQQGQ